MHTFDLFDFSLPDVMTLVLLDKVICNVHINVNRTVSLDRGVLKLFDYALMTCEAVVK